MPTEDCYANLNHSYADVTISNWPNTLNVCNGNVCSAGSTKANGWFADGHANPTRDSRTFQKVQVQWRWYGGTTDFDCDLYYWDNSAAAYVLIATLTPPASLSYSAWYDCPGITSFNEADEFRLKFEINTKSKYIYVDCSCMRVYSTLPYSTKVRLIGNIYAPQPYSTKVRNIGIVELAYATKVRNIGTIIFPYSSKVRNIGNVIIGYSTKVRNIGIIQGFYSAKVRNIGSIGLAYSTKVRLVGIVQGLYSAKVRNIGNILTTYSSKVRLIGILEGLYSSKVRSIGTVVSPYTAKARLTGIIKGLSSAKARLTGRIWFELPDGANGRLIMGAITLLLYGVTATPSTKQSQIAKHVSPGSSGISVQYLGSRPQSVDLKGFMKGSTAKGDIDTLKTMLGEQVRADIMGHGAAQWISGSYLVEAVTYELLPGKPDPAGATKVSYSITLKRRT